MPDSFSETLRQRSMPIWERIFSHPFIAEAKAGTLPTEKFAYYITQDYKYLSAFARVVAIALAKAPSGDQLELIARRMATPTERPLHRRLMPMLGLTQDDVKNAPISPTNLAYCNHMIAVATLQSWPAAIAALLPCPWTYDELGEKVGVIDHPIFGPWSEVYATGGLNDGVNLWRELLDEAAGQATPLERERITEAFIVSSRYEYMFWEMAYTLEPWIV